MRECRRDRPLFVFGMERDRVLSQLCENWQRLLLRFMAGASIRDWRGSRVADWTNRQKYQQFWRVKTWGSIQINFFAAKKDRRTKLPENLFATFRGKKPRERTMHSARGSGARGESSL